MESNLAAAGREAVRQLAHVVHRRQDLSAGDVGALRDAVSALGRPPAAQPSDLQGSASVVPSNPCCPDVDCVIDADGLHGTVEFSEVFAGIGPFAHGGFIAVAMETALGSAALFHATARSATMTVDYKAPAPIGRLLEVRARVDRIEGRKHWVSGSISDGDQVIAEGHGLWVALRPD